MQSSIRLVVLPLLLGLCNSANVRYKNLPSFTWDEDKSSSHGIPLLKIHFNDNEAGHDYIALRLSQLHADASVKHNVYEADLLGEGSAASFVGKPLSNDFSVMLQSRRLAHEMFHVKDGKVEAEMLGKRNAGGTIHDIAIHPPSDIANNFTKTPRNTESTSTSHLLSRNIADGCPGNVRYKILAIYDNNFLSHNGGNSATAEATITSVMGFTQTVFGWTALNPCGKMQIEMLGFEHINGTWFATTADIEALRTGYSAQFRDGDGNLINADAYLYFLYQNGQPGTIGIAYVGATCLSTANYRTALVEWLTSNLFTAYITAHELGHNLGMEHDFLSDGSARFDSANNNCTNVHGIMDYDQIPYDKWTNCSLEDFQAYVKRVSGGGGAFCLEEVNATTTTTQSTTTMTTTTTETTTTITTTTTETTTMTTTTTETTTTTMTTTTTETTTTTTSSTTTSTTTSSTTTSTTSSTTTSTTTSTTSTTTSTTSTTTNTTTITTTDTMTTTTTNTKVDCDRNCPGLYYLCNYTPTIDCCCKATCNPPVSRCP